MGAACAVTSGVSRMAGKNAIASVDGPGLVAATAGGVGHSQDVLRDERWSIVIAKCLTHAKRAHIFRFLDHPAPNAPVCRHQAVRQADCPRGSGTNK